MPALASPQGKLEKRPGFFSAPQTSNLTITRPYLCSLTFSVRSGAEEMNTEAREGVARAERELMMRPENPRPAYLGAVGLAALGEIYRAKEWADELWRSIPTIVWPNICGLLLRASGRTYRAIDLLVELLPGATHEQRGG